MDGMGGPVEDRGLDYDHGPRRRGDDGGVAVKEHAEYCHLLPLEKGTSGATNSSCTFLCDHRHRSKATWQWGAILPHRRLLISHITERAFGVFTRLIRDWSIAISGIAFS
jgi:hypothetical protein